MEFFCNNFLTKQKHQISAAIYIIIIINDIVRIKKKKKKEKWSCKIVQTVKTWILPFGQFYKSFNSGPSSMK